MKGKYRVVLQNNRLHYEFEIRRNITIIQGDSATGKTTLINMLRQAENLGRSSGVDVVCEAPCRVLEGANWKLLCRICMEILFLQMKRMHLSIQRNLPQRFAIRTIILC